MVIWYDVLFYVDKVSKKLQSKATTIDAAISQINDAMKYFEKYIDEEFFPSLYHAKTIAFEMGIENNFRTKCHAQQKRQFDECDNEEVIQSPQEDFRVNYFLVLVDMAIYSLSERFE